MFIFAYGVYFKFGVKGQDQIKTKYVIRLITRTTTKGVHIWHNNCL